MDLKTVRRNLIQAVELVEGWTTQSEVSAVERDLVLDKIRKAYDAIRFGGVAHEQSLARPKAVAVAPIPQPTEQPTEQPVERPTEQSVEKPTEPESATEQESSDEPEVEFEFIVYEGEEGEEGEESEGESDENEESEGEGEKYSDDETDADLSDGEYSDVEPADEEDSEDEEPTEPIAEPIVPSEPTEKPISEKPIASEPTEEPIVPARPQNIEQSLFGGEDSAWRRPRRRSVIMSLYDADPQPSKTEQSAMPVEPQPQPTIKPQPTSTPQPATEPQAQPAIKPQPTATEHPVVAEERPAPVQYAVAPKPLEEIDAEAVLGEVLVADVHTLGDTLSHAPSVADTAPVKTLRGAISVADKFMIVRELFDGNEPAFEHAIETLDAIDDFDDCMVHIVENYSWRTSSEGAKLIIDLLQRKFQQK